MISAQQKSEIVKEHSRGTNDTGSPEVQVALLTSKIIDLTMKGPGLRKLSAGRMIEINPQKVPRVIGKAGSMISMIKEHTGCNMIVGQNGKVWISGKDPNDESLAVKAIRMIEEQSHISGLTDAVKRFLEKEAKK